MMRSRGGTEPFPLNLFTGGDNVALERSGTTYIIHQEFAPCEVFSWLLQPGTWGDYSVDSIRQCKTGRSYYYMDDADAVKTGAWSTTSSSSYWLGGRSHTNTPGAYITFTTPAYCRDVWWKVIGSNGGIFRIAIDDDYTAANMIATAQDLVDAEILPPTALVENGGILNPTDRCFDPKTNTAPFTQLATLDEGVHTVKLECTGYKNPASTSDYLYVDVVAVSAPLKNASAVIANEDLQTYSGSVYEYAINMTPAGATTPAWAGNGHGYDGQLTITYKVDGQVVTPEDKALLIGKSVEVIRTSQLHHAELETPIADVTMIYRASPKTGLTTHITIDWLVDVVVQIAYLAMWPLSDAIFDRGAGPGAAVNYTLTDNDNSYKGNQQTDRLWVWDADGTLGAVLYIPNVAASLNNWQDSPATWAFIEDRSGTNRWNKIYFTRAYAGAVFSADTRWTSEAQYRVGRFEDAEAALAYP